MGDRQLRHSRPPSRRARTRAVGRAGVRRGPLSEESHQRAQQARTRDHDPRERERGAPADRPAADRHAAHEPAPRSVRAAATRGTPARAQLPRVCEALLRGGERRVWLEDRRRVEHRRAHGAVARRDAAPIEGRRRGAAAEAANVAARGGARGHRRAGDPEGSRCSRERATRAWARSPKTGRPAETRTTARVHHRSPAGARDCESLRDARLRERRDRAGRESHRLFVLRRSDSEARQGARPGGGRAYRENARRRRGRTSSIAFSRKNPSASSWRTSSRAAPG